jgi:hypothetical protein
MCQSLHAYDSDLFSQTLHTYARVCPKIRGICPLKIFTVTPSFHVSFEAVPLGTVTNSAQKDCFERDGGNQELGQKVLMYKFPEFL